MKTGKPNDECGIALILTLTILAVILIMLLAFVSSMRTERISAKAFNDQSKAQLLAQAAIDRAVATIASATPQRTATPAVSTYVTFPGVIWKNLNGVSSFVNVYSDPTLADPVNMNADLWITGQNALEYNAVNAQINVGWLYVGEDGTVAPPPLNNTTHLVGRYAFWVDDEATKINIQTAGQRPVAAPDAYGYSTNSEVDLTMLQAGLSGSAAASSIQATQASTGFTTIEEVKRADLSGSAALDFTNNQFYLTTYSNDANYPDYADDLDAFDRQRLVLSQLSIRDANGTGGGGTNNAYAHLADVALGAMYSLNGGGATASFSGKYPVVGTVDGLRQIVANIVAYQHDPQSTTDPSAFPPDGGGTPPVFLGLAKTPYINEVQVSYTVDSAVPNVTPTVSVELFYMYDGTYMPGAGETITVSGLPVGPTFNPIAVPIPVVGTFASGSYLVFTATLPAVPFASVTTLAPSIQISYTRPYAGFSRRLDYSEMTLQSVPLNPASSGTVLHGAQAADPCVNDTDGQWEKYSTITTPTFAGTLTRRNVWQLSNPFDPLGPFPVAYSFGADMSKAVIMRGAPMQSLGELGYIHRPERWKHLTLQPGGGNSVVGQIPDWAMLDLFTVGGGTAGRININGGINAGTPVFGTTRLVPLNALLNNTLTGPNTVPQNIYDDLPAGRTVIDTYGMRNGRDGIFDSVGEICEVAGLDNGGGNDADKEAVIRRIANDVTVRSSTFTVWVWAQSIKEPDIAAGQTIGTYQPNLDLITGEVKAQAVVERYENPPGSEPRYRIRYLRYY